MYTISELILIMLNEHTLFPHSYKIYRLQAGMDMREL